jgi:hypothetical protein
MAMPLALVDGWCFDGSARVLAAVQFRAVFSFLKPAHMLSFGWCEGQA